MPLVVSVCVWVIVADILVSGSLIVAVVSGSCSEWVLGVDGWLLGGVSCCGSGVGSLGGSRV